MTEPRGRLQILDAQDRLDAIALEVQQRQERWHSDFIDKLVDILSMIGRKK